MKRILQVLAAGVTAFSLLGGLSGCNRKYEFSPVDMWNRSRLKTYEPVDFFDDKQSNRPLVPGTIARGQMYKADDAYYRGIAANGRFVTGMPPLVMDYAKGSERALLQRGQERYNIYCVMCHGAAGHGDGMVVKRGFVPPPDYRIARLRSAPVGHFFDVITNGYGAMYSYASRVPVQDRWAIAAYVRRLQDVQPQVVPDKRYRRENDREYGATSGMANAKPRNTTNNIGTAANAGSSSQVGQGSGMPGPKNPMQAIPQPGAMATPGLDER